MERNMKNIQIEYDWCQYTADADRGLFTVRRTVKVDYAMVYSQGEAVALIAKLKEIDELKKSSATYIGERK